MTPHQLLSRHCRPPRTLFSLPVRHPSVQPGADGAAGCKHRAKYSAGRISMPIWGFGILGGKNNWDKFKKNLFHQLRMFKKKAAADRQADRQVKDLIWKEAVKHRANWLNFPFCMFRNFISFGKTLENCFQKTWRYFLSDENLSSGGCGLLKSIQPLVALANRG